jgi:hypothetical protein
MFVDASLLHISVNSVKLRLAVSLQHPGNSSTGCLGLPTRLVVESGTYKATTTRYGLDAQPSLPCVTIDNKCLRVALSTEGLENWSIFW